MEEQLNLFGDTSPAVAAKKKQSLLKSTDQTKVTAQSEPLPKKEILSSKQKTTVLVFVDGAARGNPGPAGAGIYIATQNRVPLIKKGFYLQHKTNNQAEYLAFIIACLFVQNLIKNEPSTQVVFHSDSQLLVRQIQGIYKVKNEGLLALYAVAKNLLQKFSYSIVHVMREENTNADKLANIGVDKKIKITQDIAGALSAFGITID
ncbi:ribonuclease HI family protein [Candidatus Dependentiae bacterium]|nr:ribonuclease HI family protein [Candidatus Dependentiae bacterium]